MKRLEFGAGVRVCPFCETGRLYTYGLMTRCDSCDRIIEEAVLRTIEQIAALPDALGKHACECGHPEMRRLPDRVLHCPACGSEVIPQDRYSTSRNSRGPINGGLREAA